MLSSDHKGEIVYCGLLVFRVPLTQWWDTKVLRCLPQPYEQVYKCCTEIVRVSQEEEMVDGYVDYHRPYEFSLLSDTFAYKISHSVRYLPNIFLVSTA